MRKVGRRDHDEVSEFQVAKNLLARPCKCEAEEKFSIGGCDTVITFSLAFGLDLRDLWDCLAGCRLIDFYPALKLLLKDE